MPASLVTCTAAASYTLILHPLPVAYRRYARAGAYSHLQARERVSVPSVVERAFRSSRPSSTYIYIHCVHSARRPATRAWACEQASSTSSLGSSSCSDPPAIYSSPSPPVRSAAAVRRSRAHPTPAVIIPIAITNASVVRSHIQSRKCLRVPVRTISTVPHKCLPAASSARSLPCPLSLLGSTCPASSLLPSYTPTHSSPFRSLLTHPGSRNDFTILSLSLSISLALFISFDCGISFNSLICTTYAFAFAFPCIHISSHLCAIYSFHVCAISNSIYTYFGWRIPP
ncbi:hypothetical protein C8R45DRAFT_960216 [Mycena sanguinolenta]|nr:hypothetical protein C8R45DRAFT_960216 [Mycena sanguinolenta]